jgi:hypothetical protein
MMANWPEFMQGRIELYNADGGKLVMQLIAGHDNTRQAARDRRLALFQYGGMVFGVREVGTTATIVKESLRVLFEMNCSNACH